MRQPPSSRVRSAFLALVLLIPLTACGSRAGGPSSSSVEPTPRPPDCVLTSSQAPPGTVTVALQESVDPEHAPRPRNRAEAIVFHHLYESLLQIDCRGRIRPGLARSWRTESGGRRWRFYLRADARFWDGRSVTADDVRTAWKLYGGTSFLASIGTPPTITTIGERELVVEWPDSRARRARLFAAPALAVLRPSALSRWPVGTGSHRPDPNGPVRSGAEVTIHLEPGPLEPLDRAAIRLRVAPGRDGRDLLDDGADLLVTSDPATLEYASVLGDRIAIPLAWDRTHGLWIPGRFSSALEVHGGGHSRHPTSRLESLREALARDAVPAEARPVAGTAGPGDAPACDRLPVANRAPVGPDDGEKASQGRSLSRSGARSIAYRDGDQVGRALASRLVALLDASGSKRSEERAWLRELIGAGHTSVSVRAISDSAYAFAVADTGPADLAYVASIVPWTSGPCAPPFAGGPGGSWLPLVETRERLVVREGRATVGLGAWGALRIGDPRGAGAAP